ncbi:MAG: histidine phosphatase family protein, partial [Pseudorhodobacter sp.]|nr:histidine phosphatase family protein [Frankiaceae bacterium]
MEGLPGHPVRRPGRRAGGGPVLSRRLVLLRHGRTSHNASGVIQGQLDIALDELGRAQAVAAARVLAAVRPDVLVSSDLSRARETAEVLAAACDLPVTFDPRLRELDLGSWQGLTSEQAREQHPDEHAAWLDGVDVPRGGGETYAQAGARAAEAVLSLELPPDGTLVAVTHGGTARAAVAALL